MIEETLVHVPSRRSSRGAWLVVAGALVGTLLMAATLEWVNRAELVSRLGPPLSRFEVSAVRELATADAWGASGFWVESGEMMAAVGDRHPGGELAAYAYYMGSFHQGIDNDERCLELARRAVAMAQPGTRHYASIYRHLVRTLVRTEQYEEASTVLERGIARAAPGKERVGLLVRAGDLYEERGRSAEALAAWRRVAIETDKGERAREAIERITAGEAHHGD